MTDTPSKLAGRKILWVEDDTFLESMVANRFTKESCTLLRAENGEAAIDIAKKEKPDIVVLDVLLAGMDGIEILKHLKEDDDTKAIPVVMFSNLDDPEKVSTAKALGASGYFIKAYVSLDDIITELAKALAPSTPAK